MERGTREHMGDVLQGGDRLFLGTLLHLAVTGYSALKCQNSYPLKGSRSLICKTGNK